MTQYQQFIYVQSPADSRIYVADNAGNLVTLNEGTSQVTLNSSSSQQAVTLTAVKPFVPKNITLTTPLRLVSDVIGAIGKPLTAVCGQLVTLTAAKTARLLITVLLAELVSLTRVKAAGRAINIGIA